MKKLLLIPILLISLNSISQNYVPFLDTNKMWFESYYHPNDLNQTLVTSGVYSLKFQEISNNKYQLIKNIVFHTSWTGFGSDPDNYWNPYTPDYTIGDNDTIAILVEDTILKKVYIANEQDSILLYDFNLGLGDTTHALPFFENSNTKLDSTSQESLWNGETFTRYFLRTSYHLQCDPKIQLGNDEELIHFDSRMGGNLKLLQPFKALTFETISEYCRVCYAENGEVLWGDSTDCKAYLRHLEYGDLGINNIESREKSFSIYPNPTNNVITLNFGNEYHSGTVQLCTLDGKMLLRTTINNMNQQMIDMSAYPSGVYLVHYTSGDGLISETQHVIKN